MTGDDYRDDQAVAAELGLLACALDSPTLARQASPDVFTHYLRRELWAALQNLADRDQAPDATTLAPHVRDLAEAMRLVVSLMGTGFAANVPAYLEVVLDRAERRRLDNLAASLRQRASDLQHPIADAATWAAAELGKAPRDTGRTVLQRFPTLDLAALLDPHRPPREWVVSGLLPAGASVSLVAAAGTGKSLLALAVSLAIVRGHRAFADLSIPRRRRVLYLDMENTADDLAERFAAFGVRPTDDLSELTFLHLPDLDPLDTPRGGRDLEAIVDAYGLRRGDLVVLDSLQRVTGGAENDSDTLRAFYACTAVALKRRGLTVLRTDNTGKDADKGARGTSGKRDDVDLELILTRDAETSNRLRITPGKARIPDARQLLLTRDEDEHGRLTYASAGDPFRALVLDAWRALDDLGADQDASERTAWQMLTTAGRKIPRAAVRAAVKERKECAVSLGAPLLETPRPDCADTERRTLAHAGVSHG